MILKKNVNLYNICLKFQNTSKHNINRMSKRLLLKKVLAYAYVKAGKKTDVPFLQNFFDTVLFSHVWNILNISKIWTYVQIYLLLKKCLKALQLEERWTFYSLQNIFVLCCSIECIHIAYQFYTIIDTACHFHFNFF